MGPRGILGQLGLDCFLQVCPHHLSQANQENRSVRQFFRQIRSVLPPGVECLRDLAVQQAEFQRNVRGVEAFSKLVLPGERLYLPNIHRAFL
jgi:hypothetical protein